MLIIRVNYPEKRKVFYLPYLKVKLVLLLNTFIIGVVKLLNAYEVEFVVMHYRWNSYA